MIITDLNRGANESVLMEHVALLPDYLRVRIAGAAVSWEPLREDGLRELLVEESEAEWVDQEDGNMKDDSEAEDDDAGWEHRFGDTLVGSSTSPAANLTTLDLSFTKLSLKAIRNLLFTPATIPTRRPAPTFPSLTTLILIETPQISFQTAFLDLLSNMISLRHLSLAGNSLVDGAASFVARLASSTPGLNSLDLSYVEGLGPTSLWDVDWDSKWRELRVLGVKGLMRGGESKGAPSEVMTEKERSKEAPMEGLQYTSPRSFPASPFASVSNMMGSPMSEEDGGERARKRTHYEAMDVDTPPRPSQPQSDATSNPPPSLPPFSPSATATSDPFHFSAPPAPPAIVEPHLEFDPKKFEPEKAFGLDDEEEAEEGDESKAVGFVGDATRRRRGGAVGKKEKSPERRRRRSRSGSRGEMDRRIANGEFSFQVHHHHGPSGSDAGGGMSQPEKWLNSNTPYTLLGYLQFASLTLLLVLLLFLALLFLYTLYTDVQMRLHTLQQEIRAEILGCARDYVNNRCEPATRIPAMEARCSGWEECMGREPVVVGKTRVVAETLAGILDGFVDVISFKTMIFVILTLGITIYGSSAALSLLPSRPAATSTHTVYPTGAPAPHFQHLGYGPPPGYGYSPLPSPAYGQRPWDVAEKQAESMGLAAPPAAQTEKKKGWF
ncbi:nucleus export protein Brr6 [Pseudohyphozyma bogoriensis]|nr:nucleus export protein Brr6 [Pseudohyphozyma bogoriensis]